MRALAIVIAMWSGNAFAENCKPKEKVLLEGGTPCWDVSVSYGEVATWLAPGFRDARADLLRMNFFTNREAAWRFTLADGEKLDGDGYVGSAVAFGYGADFTDWGWYVMGRAITRAGDATRLVTPAFGLRVGHFDRTAFVGEARFDDVRLLDLSRDTSASVARDFDFRARATQVLARWLRVEARGRFRDATLGGRTVRDVSGALGVELAVAGKDGFRVMPLFVGIGARRALVDTAMTPAGWQVLGWVELDFAVNSSHVVW